MNTEIKQYIEVIVPLSVEGLFTYSIPKDINDNVQVGCRVEIEFGKKRHYAAIVRRIVLNPIVPHIKPILQIIDVDPIVSERQLEYWEWMSRYYMAPIGDVMNTALIAAYKLESNTLITRTASEYHIDNLSDNEYLILEALDIRHQLTIQEIQNIVQRKTILPLIKNLIDSGLIVSREELSEQDKPVMTKWIRINPELLSNASMFNETMSLLEKSEKKTHYILSYLRHCKKGQWIKSKLFHQVAQTDSSALNSLVKKKIFEVCELHKYDIPNELIELPNSKLSPAQEQALIDIKNIFLEKSYLLLHGVTGSGKTMLYIHLIKEIINQGKQILFLVPEISLTTQLVKRLQTYFGDSLIEYHSGITSSHKLSIWRAIAANHQIVIGARSAIHLPFQNLGLIIVDEEHDASFKQHESSPYYNARDAALYLAHLHQAKVVLGSATPSIETYYNAMNGKYGVVNLADRFGDSVLPDIKIIPLKLETQLGHMAGHFSKTMIDEITKQIQQNKQVLVFRNRRGYSPIIQCGNCNFESICDRCDIHLTLHKYSNKLKCHICNAQKTMPTNCPQCNLPSLKILGFGTEQIEEEMNNLFPEVNIKRLDLDAARTRKSQREIIEEFEDGDFDILIGTQMITKGFDFSRVGLVAVIQADQLLMYPDFRSHERGYQLLTQVSGRAGRRLDQGTVLIQAYASHHPILKMVINQNYEQYYHYEISERNKFQYPPFTRLVRIELRHTKIELLNTACNLLYKNLSTIIQANKILGPAEPHISKIKGAYIREFVVKLERNKSDLSQVKKNIKDEIFKLKTNQGLSSLRIKIDVDPY